MQQAFAFKVSLLIHSFHRKQRDELSHNVFLMLQESNKFREHQAREILIDLLEKQLEQRRKILENLRHQVSLTYDLLRDIDEPLET